MRFINAKQLRRYFGEEKYLSFVKEITGHIKKECEKYDLFFDIYFEQPGRLYLIIDNYDFDFEGIVRDIYAGLIDEIIKIESQGGKVIPRFCEIRYPDDTNDPETIFNAGSQFHRIIPYDQFYTHAGDIIDTDNFKLLVKGTGEIFLHDVICDNVQMEVEGTGNIDVDNITTQRADMQVKGTGNCEATIFNARRVDCSLTGTGNIDVTLHNCGTVSATLGGTGNIELKGDVRRVNKHQSGIGDIDTEELKVIE